MESGILNEALLHDDEFGDAKKSDRLTWFYSFIIYKTSFCTCLYDIFSRDFTNCFVTWTVHPSVGGSGGHTLLLFCFLYFCVTAPAQMFG